VFSREAAVNPFSAIVQYVSSFFAAAPQQTRRAPNETLGWGLVHTSTQRRYLRGSYF
jgi:hypothetical protein